MRISCTGGFNSADPGVAVTAARQSAALAAPPAAPVRYRAWLLVAAGVVLFAAAGAVYAHYALTHPYAKWLSPVDLEVYRDGGRIAAHIPPWYKASREAPLYDWPGYYSLKFTYPPFAAMTFTVLTLASYWTVVKISVVVNTIVMAATIWMTFGGLGYRRSLVRLGATLLLAAPLFWSEPVQRVLYLGQIEIVLMALVIWDQVQPDRRWWKGAGIGIAAGIKLVPLIFIPYLLLTRRFRQAAVAAGAFVATVLIGFAVLPADSVKWWFGGLFVQGSRTGFVGWEGNQSLQGIITRLTGSIAAGRPVWLVAALVTAIVGLVCAAILDRAGHRMVGLLTCALTGLLISPISWDHHWVWIVPGTVVAVVYAVRARRLAVRLAWAALAAAIMLTFGAWPGSLWGNPDDLGTFSKGFIWAPPNTSPGKYYKLGDRPWFAEYHWHGLELIAGNLYILAGLGLFVLLMLLALGPGLRAVRGGPPPGLSSGSSGATPAGAAASAEAASAGAAPAGG
jgi:alpha-1,2-mannosyltransferase